MMSIQNSHKGVNVNLYRLYDIYTQTHACMYISLCVRITFNIVLILQNYSYTMRWL